MTMMMMRWGLGAILATLLLGCGSGGSSSGSSGVPPPAAPPPAPPPPPPPPPPEHRVVFIADRVVDEEYHIYSCKADGSDLVDLCGSLVAGGDVFSFKTSPDGTHVTLSADRDTNNFTERYVVPIAGGTLVKLDGNVPGVLIAVSWSSDSLRIAYLATYGSSAQELFVSDRDGANNVKVSGAMTAGGNMGNDFAWAPDGSRIAYAADQNTDGVLEVFTSLPDGTGNVRVCGALTAGREVRIETLQWAPDSSRLCYVADQDTDDIFELYTVDPAGNQNVKASGTMVAGGDVITPTSGIVMDRYWAPDASRISYVADQDSDDVFELYTSLPGGGGNVKVSGSLAAGGDVMSDFAWAPDSSRIAFRSDKEVDETFELYAAFPTGAPTYQLSGSLVSGGDVQLSFVHRSFEWAPDSSRIAYLAFQRQANLVELFTSQKDGSGNVLVSGDNPTCSSSYPLRWAPNGARILFYGLREASTFELFTCVPDGSIMDKVSGTMVAGGDIDPNVAFLWAPSSYYVVYAADQLTDGRVEVFSSLPDGQSNVKISGSMVAGGNAASLDVH